MMRIERKIVLVTRHTQMDRLRRKFNTRAQAEFYIERAVELDQIAAAAMPAAALAGAGVMRKKRAGQAAPSPKMALRDAIREDDLYQDAISQLRKDLSDLLPLQVVDRSLVPTLSLGPADVVVTVGQDGLVANTAKYAVNRPIVAVNPDPASIDGILLPFTVDNARAAVVRVLNDSAKVNRVTLAQASLNNGQRLLAFNDLFIGAKTHVSARYRIDVGATSETQSSSGVLVSTGAGSTGWLSSVYNMAMGLAGRSAVKPLRMKWDDRRLAFVVREPFVSKTTAASIVSGMIDDRDELLIESAMAQNGVVFSDGVEADFLQFNSGDIVRISAAEERALLVAA